MIRRRWLKTGKAKCNADVGNFAYEISTGQAFFDALALGFRRLRRKERSCIDRPLLLEEGVQILIEGTADDESFGGAGIAR